MSKAWFLAFSPFLYVDFFAFLKLVWSTVHILLLISSYKNKVIICYDFISMFIVSIEGSFVE
ncbi:hypothetical protein Hanom_Chr00s000004g01609051 [Helianthus anomalus]